MIMIMRLYINTIFLSISFVVVSISMPMEVCSYACMHDIVLSRCSSTFVFVNKLYIHTHTIQIDRQSELMRPLRLKPAVCLFVC